MWWRIAAYALVAFAASAALGLCIGALIRLGKRWQR